MKTKGTLRQVKTHVTEVKGKVKTIRVHEGSEVPCSDWICPVQGL